MAETGTTAPEKRSRSAPERLLDNYGLVLILLVASFLVIPLADRAPGWRVAMILLAGAALLATYRASDVRSITMAIASAFVILAVVSALIAEIADGSFRNEWLLMPLGAMLIAGPWVILKRIFQAHRTVTLQTILGAICAYMYFGLIFAVTFATTEAVGSEPFFAQTTDPTAGDFSYFSFVTMTTLGYGDLSPSSQVGQHLAVVEALVGSLYLVTLVGRLVAMYGSQEVGPRESGETSAMPSCEAE